MTTQTIDDQDLSHVKYVGNWVRGGSSGEYKGTVASSTRVNDSFTVSFKGNYYLRSFRTSISVYGTIDATSGGVVTSYALGEAQAAEVTSSAGAGDTFGQLFWASPTLVASEDRQLVVKMVKINPNNQSGEGTIWFDYFKVTGAPPPQKNVNIGAIVGGVVGVRTHPDRAIPNTKHNPMVSTDHSPVTPITPNNSKRGPSSFATTPVSPSTVEEATGGSTSNLTPSSPLSPTEPLQHRDSGMRDVHPISVLPDARVELPPVYSPI
ncbi:hypothetical protein M413DRAFT_12732 [Hebeloma cylindrosporum]|uniref:Uncharacterized protein n=1 Tax=Hebeloma cylindrosporum TaxID=76867 RepID=A0A0C3C4J5_HEBCY|nr:hypothetical protein M413DRAFT_12732 [Hebeloma cylindrosporum h7]